MVLPQRTLAEAAAAEAQHQEGQQNPNPQKDPAPDRQSPVLLLVPGRPGEKGIKHPAEAHGGGCAGKKLKGEADT